jgi:acyl-CoA synthetase (AMP-forming)/AMP-acid ligase II
VGTVLNEHDAEPRLFDAAKKAGVELVCVTPDSRRTGFIHLNGDEGTAAEEPERPRPDDVLALLHTSGTTGRPKVIPMTQISRVLEAANFSPPVRLSSADRCLNAMPLHHGQGLVGEFQNVLLQGASVAFAPFDARRFVSQVEECRATTFTLVPAMHQAVVEAIGDRTAVFRGGAVRYVRSTSAMLPLTLLRDMRAAYGVPIIQQYAASECGIIAMTEFDESLNRGGAVGRVVREDAAIMDDNGNILPAEAPGEICVKESPLVITRYENNPDADAEAFRDGWYRTGDGGYIDEDGYLFLTGRVREVINRGGEKISPAEVDSRFGQEVMAAVVARHGVSLDPEEVRAHASERLSYGKVPKKVFIVPELPLNATGKVMRSQLAAWLGPGEPEQ